ncbi:T9SS type A sorting domain-containing protein, partial [bacterium]|nr:T9SS type A sorting domain-containing protein [bacterium]
QGDQVEITGSVAEVNGMTVIQNVTSFDVLSSGNTLYSPMAVNTAGLAVEANEGCLMQVEDVTVTEPGAGMADFQVDDSSGDCWIGANADWYHWPAMDEPFAYVRGVVNYVAGEFKLEPRLTNDITPPGRDRTLQWVQQVRYSDLMDLEDFSYAVDDTVTISGVVTMPTGLSYAGAGVKFIYQDVHGGPWSSILSYDPDASTFPFLLEGDSVSVTGYISEYTTDMSNMTEIFITEPIDLLGIGADIPEEPVVATGDLRWPTEAEQWGTVMVKVHDAVVINNNLPYNEWSVNDGSGSVNVDDDSDSLSNFIRPPVGTSIEEIRGWVYHHYGYYTDSTTYKVEPLYMEDITIGSGPPDVLGVVREPGIVMDGDPVSIISEITDNSLVITATINYRFNNGSWEEAEMEFTGGFFWEGEIPEGVTGDWVDFYITAEDDSSNIGQEPPNIEEDMFCYPVVDSNVLTIHDVQYTPWPAGNSPFNGYEVTVEGIVTADTVANARYSAFVIQDVENIWSGIVIDDITMTLLRDQLIQVTGIVDEADTNFTYKWSGNTKLTECTNVQVLGAGAIAPMLVSTWDLSLNNPDVESYEGCLVEVSNLTVTSNNQYDWSIDDGTGECLIDDDASRMDSVFAMITPGSTFERIAGFFIYSFGTYKIELRDYDDYAGFVGIKDYQPQVASEFKLNPAYPNPFNAHTRISYSLPTTDQVDLIIYNLMGQQVRTLVKGTQTAGQHIAVWDGRDNFGQLVSSGMYIYRIMAGENIAHHKMVLLK